jgi:hypothetical protein
MRWLLVGLLIATLFPTQSTQDGSQSEANVRSVVIFVHGQTAGPGAYGEWIRGAPFGGTWDPEVWYLEMNWGSLGPASIFDYSSGIGTRFDRIAFDEPGDDRIGWGGLGALPWDGVTKIQQLVGRTRLLLGDEVSITAIGHSTGTNIILAALQEGLRIDNFILMGSPLSNHSSARCTFNTRFDLASRQVNGTILNFYSSRDQSAQLGARFERRRGTGLGYSGLSEGICNESHEPDNIIDVDVGDAISNHFQWWADWITGTDHVTRVATMLRGERDAISFGTDIVEAFSDIQASARQNPDALFVNDSSPVKALQMYLLPGARTGLYFFKQREMQYSITCQQGAVRSAIRREVDGRWRKVRPPKFASSLTNTRTDTYETEKVDFLFFATRQRATLQTEVVALGSGIAVCTLVVTASR